MSEALGARLVSGHVRPMSSGKHILYFALQPSPDAAAQALVLAEEVRRAHRLPGKPVAPARLHVSLNYLGEFKRPPGSVVTKALEAAAQVAQRDFVVEFNRLGSWGRGDAPRKFVLWGEDGVIGVNGLYSALHRALGRFDLAPRREASVEPHMTLIHDGADIESRFVEPIRWRAREFVLIHAVHGEGRYEVAGRMPLSA